MKYVLAILILSIALCAITGCPRVNGGNGQGPAAGAKVGDAATDFSLPDQNSVIRALSDYRGQVIVLDFSATWCGPCRYEAETSEAHFQQHKDQGFVIITVLIDSDVSVTTCVDWADTYGITFPVLADESSTAWNIYNEEGYIPLNIVIDRDFVIQYKEVGYDEDAILSTIETLL